MKIRKTSTNTGVVIEKYEFACITYLVSIQSENLQDIANKVLKEAVAYFGKEEFAPRKKPKTPKNPYQWNFRFNQEYRPAIAIIKVNNHMLDWTFSDFFRFGLKRVIKDYATTYPEIEKIVRRYESEGENETQ